MHVLSGMNFMMKISSVIVIQLFIWTCRTMWTLECYCFSWMLSIQD